MSRITDIAKTMKTWWDEDDDTFVHRALDEIIHIDQEQAPTIEPKRGKWIDNGWHGDWQFETDGRGNCWHEYECSECGFHNKGGKSNFCPNCGADMRGKDDEVR